LIDIECGPLGNGFAEQQVGSIERCDLDFEPRVATELFAMTAFEKPRETLPATSAFSDCVSGLIEEVGLGQLYC